MRTLFGSILVLSATLFSGCAAVSAVKCTFKPARAVTACVDEEFGTSFSSSGPTAPAKRAPAKSTKGKE